MTISHDHSAKIDGGPFVFAALGGFTCSICAPAWMTVTEVEAFAGKEVGDMPEHEWHAVNKAELGMGSPTPNPCNQAPNRRLHWFLLCEVA